MHYIKFLKQDRQLASLRRSSFPRPAPDAQPHEPHLLLQTVLRLCPIWCKISGGTLFRSKRRIPEIFVRGYVVRNDLIRYLSYESENEKVAKKNL